MNKFRKLGFIHYNGDGVEVHSFLVECRSARRAAHRNLIEEAPPSPSRLWEGRRALFSFRTGQ